MSILRYFAGNNISKVLYSSKKILNTHRYPIINYVIEDNQKNSVYNEYINLLPYLDSNYKIALKLSSLEFDTGLIHNLIDNYKIKNIPVIIDAEDNKNINKYRSITNELIYKYNKSDIQIIKTYQMYRTDSLNELKDDIIDSNKYNHILINTN